MGQIGVGEARTDFRILLNIGGSVLKLNEIMWNSHYVQF
jgi:hypothetical protein